MKDKCKMIITKLLLFTLLLTMVSGNYILPASAAGISLTESGGWFESAYKMETCQQCGLLQSVY